MNVKSLKPNFISFNLAFYLLPLKLLSYDKKIDKLENLTCISKQFGNCKLKIG